MPARKKDAHKGDFGRVAVVAGSVGMAGAGRLAAAAALRSGAGLVWLATPASVRHEAASSLASIMTVPLPETAAGTAAMGSLPKILALKPDAVLVGPGLGRDRETALLVRDLIAATSCPLVIDADGLWAARMLLPLPGGGKRPVILTPHPGEMAMMTGRTVPEIQAGRKAAAKGLARKASCVVILKGSGTVISDGKRTAVNRTGNPGMATAGAGDVLAGVAAALLGQGFDAFDAAVLAAHAHGLAGDLAAKALGRTSMTADDILAMLPSAFRKPSA